MQPVSGPRLRLFDLPIASFRESGWRGYAWLAVLVASSVAFSLGFACATPLAAFAAAAALTLNRSDALWLVGAVWLAGQAVGYGILGYPWTWNSVSWGVVLGLAAVAATLGVRALVPRFAGANTAVRVVAAFAVAFAVYELILFVAAVTGLGELSNYMPAVVARILAINAVAFAGLLVLHQIGMTTGLAPRQAQAPSLASASPAA
jgi:hypothetical protein